MIRAFTISLAALAALAAPAVAWAAEPHAAAAATPFSGNVGNAIWTVVIFLLVLFVLGKYAWGPILRGLQAREDFIRSALEHAKRDRDEAESRLKEYADKIQQARSEASALVDEGRRDAEALKHKILAEAKHEHDLLLDRARREIDVARETAIKDLYTASAKLTTQVAAKILGREIKSADHDRLIRDAVEALGEEQRSN